ncbi:hypothetical protein HMPREF0322_02334 [Desulfitobacterium hafniense DP7]|uniref:Uncharacterized protein n=1 Tax=Desulfitobacterium hafniense DP7 TaxID=537010 RepID=G9XMZ3_DESHA|nr:hypothetical protein HMPREF0322_02334 [Desulfitobacterium hafniense DP7]
MFIFSHQDPAPLHFCACECLCKKIKIYANQIFGTGLFML